MATTQNKLTPLLVVIAAVIVGYVLWVRNGTSNSASPAGPQQPGNRPKPGDPPGGSPLPPTRSADADTPADTLATVAQTNKELRAVAQRVLDDNERLKQENVRL